MQVVAADFTRFAVGVGARGGEHPLPWPFARCVWILAVQGLGQGNGAGREVGFVDLLHRGQVRA